MIVYFNPFKLLSGKRKLPHPNIHKPTHELWETSDEENIVANTRKKPIPEISRYQQQAATVQDDVTPNHRRYHCHVLLSFVLQTEACCSQHYCLSCRAYPL